MLQRIRDNSSSWITKVIIGVIAVLLSFTGFEAIVSSLSNKDTAVKVNGVEITQRELLEATEMQRQQIVQQFGNDFDPNLLDDKQLKQDALDRLITRELLVQATKDADFEFSDRVLDQYILTTPEFQENGQFSQVRFDQIIQRLGYTRLQYRYAMAQDLKLTQLQAGIAGSDFLTDKEAQAFARLDQQTRDFSYKIIPADLDKVTISQQRIDEYYNSNLADFMSQEQAIVEYIELKKSSFFDDVDVSDEELKESYEKEIANLVEQRRAAHILFAIDDEHSEESAKEKADAALARINAGEDFAELAKIQSDDTGSAKDGGDLGFAGKEVYEPEFEDALYALEVNGISEPVKTQFGWHIIKLLDVQEPEVPSFDSLKAELTTTLKQQKVEQYFVEATQDLENAAYEASDLQQPAQDLGLTVSTSNAITKDGLAEGVFANRQVLQAVFSPEVLEDGMNSAVMELDPDTAVVVRVKQHDLPKQKTLAEVSERIKAILTKQEAAKAAQADGEKQLATLQQESKLIENNEAWKFVEAAPRNQEGVAPEIMQAVFKQGRPSDKAPTFNGLTLPDGSYALIQLKGVSQVEEPLKDEELKLYKSFLASRKGNDSFVAFTEQLKADAKIKEYNQ